DDPEPDRARPDRRHLGRPGSGAPDRLGGYEARLRARASQVQPRQGVGGGLARAPGDERGRVRPGRDGDRLPQALRAAAQSAERRRALLLDSPAVRGPHARGGARGGPAPARARCTGRDGAHVDVLAGEPDVREGLMGGVRRVAVALALVAAGCAAVRGPELDPKEHVRGERHRLLGEPMDRLWPALLDALPAEGLRGADADGGRGTIATATARYDPGPRARLADVGDLSAARRAGLTHVDELRVTYYLLLAPAGDGSTSVRVRSRIDAVARESAILGPG